MKSNGCWIHEVALSGGTEHRWHLCVRRSTGMGWRRRPTVHHRASTAARSDCGGVHVVDSGDCSDRQQSITERPIQWRDSTLSEPFPHSLNGATGAHTKRARRDNLQRSAQITARGNQRTRRRGHHARHSGWISEAHGSDAPEEGQQLTCDEPLRVRPARFQVNCCNGRPARQPQRTAAPTSHCSI